MSRTILLISLLAAAALQLFLVGNPYIVLGIAGEWQWTRHEIAGPLKALVSQLLPALVGMVFLYFVSVLGADRLFQHDTRCAGDSKRQQSGPPFQVTSLFLLILVAASWGWIKTCERSTPALHRDLKSLWVLYDPSSSGYFYEAAFRMESTSEFLGTYHDRMLEGDVLHVGTHPPGLFLLNQFALKTLEAAPALGKPLSWLRIRGDVDTFRQMEASAGLARRLTNNELNALFLISELTTLAAALTVVPLYYTIRCAFNALIAWRTTCLWATFPCIAIFLPKSDVLFTFTSMSAVCFGVHAFAARADIAVRYLFAVACGAVLWVGLMLSLAHLPVVALLAALFVLRQFRISKRDGRRARSRIPVSRRSLFLRMATIPGTIVLSTAVFSLATHCNMVSVWQQNLTNHAGFYEQNTRSYLYWLAINPLELGVAIGLPVALICVRGVMTAMSDHKNHNVGPNDSLGIDLTLAVVVTICALWLSGRNSGEAARLWCFLTPWLLVLAAHVFRSEKKSDGLANSAKVWKTLLFVQIVVCALTAARVSGFTFSATQIPVS